MLRAAERRAYSAAQHEAATGAQARPVSVALGVHLLRCKLGGGGIAPRTCAACKTCLRTSPCLQLLRHLQDGLREVPAEVAELISRRTLSLVELPAELEDALADALRTGGGMRLLRRQTAALTQELKARSRTESRGGVYPAAALAAPDAAPRAKRPRLQARGRAAGTPAPLPASCSALCVARLRTTPRHARPPAAKSELGMLPCLVANVRVLTSLVDNKTASWLACLS